MIDQPPLEREPHDRVSEERERARLLADVLRDQAKRAEAALEAEARSHRRARIRRGVLVAVWAAAAYVWLISPGWTRVDPTPVPTLAEDVRSLRINLFLQAEQVEGFQASRGRLPWVLQEAGPPLPGMEYRRRDSQSYEIQARSHRVHLSYTSDRPPLDLVGPAAGILTAKKAARAAFSEQGFGQAGAGSDGEGGP